MHPDVNNTYNSEYQIVDEVLRGFGVTYYTKNNFFISGNAGLGKFFITDKATGDRYDTDNGFGFSTMVGKEWWISKKHSLGIAFEYGGTFLQDTELTQWKTQRYSIRLTWSISRPS